MCHEPEALAVNTCRSRNKSVEQLRMNLMTPQKWAEKYFDEGSRPSEVSMRRWLNDGKLPGRKVGGTWYVDEHAWIANGNELVLRVLNNS